MFAEIQSGLAAVKGAKDLLTGALDAKVDAEVKAKVYEAREQLGKAQDTMHDLRSQNLDLLEQNSSLKTELAAAQGWQAKLDAYELVKAVGGAMVYRYKAEPLHYACPSCLNKHEIHILQDLKVQSGIYECTGCKSSFGVDRETYSSYDDRDASDWRTA